MNPLAVVSFYNFLKGIAEALPSENYSSYGVTENQAQLLKILHRKIIKIFWMGIITVTILVPALVNLKTAILDPVAADERVFRFALPWMMTPINLIAGITLGFGSGLIRLPVWYLHSQFGDRWKALAGTESEVGIKIISILLCVIAIGYSLFLFWISGKTGITLTV